MNYIKSFLLIQITEAMIDGNIFYPHAGNFSPPPLPPHPPPKTKTQKKKKKYKNKTKY